MKKNGILNDRISGLIAEMGHKESLMICDAGMPIPRECYRVDIALTAGIPGFLETLKAVLQELRVESVILAEEIQEHNKSLEKQILGLFPDVPVEYVPHTDMKTDMVHTKGVIRTGEFSPYANIQLISGVVF